MVGTVELGRSAFAHRRWAEAQRLLSAGEPLEPEDLEQLAVAAYLAGRDADSARAWERAHRAFARSGRWDAAARCAAWLGFGLLLQGDVARGGGWLARAERIVADDGHDCPARGLLLVPAFLGALEAGDPATARRLASEVVAIGRRFGDADVEALGVLCCGEASLALGDTTGGMRLLDEVMVAVTADEVSPVAAGIVYCAVIEACMGAFDLRRAAEWTKALHDWCEGQPEIVPYRGQCLVHRSQVLQAHGAWAEALDEAERAHRHLSEPAHPALGQALYQEGELHRLRGELAEAERAYRAASAAGRDPAPGLALLRLAEGSVDAAVAAVRRLVEESRGQLTRPTMLAAAVEVLVAGGCLDEARAASDELGRIADAARVPLLEAMACFAAGSVRLADRDATGALGPLRRACQLWRRLEMPYDGARARVRLGLACRAVGDDDAAHLELAGARAVFSRLGARIDLEAIGGGPDPLGGGPAGITAREREVLRLVARGCTNRRIAAELVISEHTVARHLQNIFTKLGLSSRSAATAYAYEHGVV